MRATVFVRAQLAGDFENRHFVATDVYDRCDVVQNVTPVHGSYEDALGFAGAGQPKSPRVKPPSMEIVWPVT